MLEAPSKYLYVSIIIAGVKHEQQSSVGHAQRGIFVPPDVDWFVSGSADLMTA